MSNRRPNQNRKRAEELAEQLRQKVEKYFPEPAQDDRHAEMNALKAEIEKLGFTSTYSVGLTVDLKTGTYAAVATVELFDNKSSPIVH